MAGSNGVPRGIVCIRCYNCDGLYTTNRPPCCGFHRRYYEQCPICGYDENDKDNIIPLMKFKFIRWWRGIRNGDSDD